MEPNFWHDRWENKQIGFHQGEVNPFLVKYWQALDLAPDAKVFVPLCGKSLDMCFVAEQGHEVVGCELNEQGVKDFFVENNLPFSITRLDDHQIFKTEQLSIFQGDMFSLPVEQIQDCFGFYDRAALIAWPDSMRVRYVKQLAKLLPSGSRGLLVTLDFEPDVISGPPFAVSEPWVVENMRELFEVTLLTKQDVLLDNPRFIKKQAKWLDEAVYQLVRK